MGNRILVYTALFGGYDRLLEPMYIDDKCDYICVTDDKTLVSEKWKIQLSNVENNPIEMNRMYKILPHRFFSSYDVAMYVDSNIQLKKSPSRLITDYLKEAPIAFPKHFLRSCIYQEAKVCLEHKKIKSDEYTDIVENLLRKNKFPSDIGLAENNILIRDISNPEIKNAMEKWWVIFGAYAPRDQLSLMYVLWQEGLKYSFMKESSRNDNEYFSYELHKHNQSNNAFKNKLISMASMRDKNIINKCIAKLLDKL